MIYGIPIERVGQILNDPLPELIKVALLTDLKKRPEFENEFWLMTGVIAARLPDEYKALKVFLIEGGRAWDVERVRTILREVQTLL